MSFDKAKELIEKSKTIYIVSHINPDGDAIGSSFGIYLALKKLNKDVHVVMPCYSDSFRFLPNISEAQNDIYVENYDLLIALDSSDITRLALDEDKIYRANDILMLDHHQKTHPYGSVQCIDDSLSSASEIVYNFVKYLEISFDKEIATYLYMGIMTDTGSFNYSNAKAATYRAAAELIENGADSTDICKKLNDTIKESKLKLIAKTVDNMEVYFDSKLRLSVIDYNTIKELGLDEEDAEGMTNYLRMVEGTLVAIYIRGRSDGTYKVSMRSGGEVDVSKIAIGFGGGGHPRAAGFSISGDEIEIKQKILNAVEVMIN